VVPQLEPGEVEELGARGQREAALVVVVTRVEPKQQRPRGGVVRAAHEGRPGGGLIVIPRTDPAALRLGGVAPLPRTVLPPLSAGRGGIAPVPAQARAAVRSAASLTTTRNSRRSGGRSPSSKPKSASDATCSNARSPANPGSGIPRCTPPRSRIS